MRTVSLRLVCSIALTFGALMCAVGCRSSDSFDMSGRIAAWNTAKANACRELAQISVPSKSVYLAVDRESRWQNPFLTVESNMIQVRIYLPDENSSPIDRGGMTRLSSARKHILNVRLKDLPWALSSLPSGAWPYGRVVAIQQEQGPPHNSARIQSNFKITIDSLNDMRVVVDNFSDRGTAP